ncbi:hypothetical protein BH11MYX1_BH11MYX1_14970 [soil metagenome]
MKYLMLALALLCACDDGDADTDEVKALKLECHAVLKHIVAVSPQGAGLDAEAVATALPSEDLGSCVASEPEIRACMVKAVDLAAVKSCIPSVKKLECMQLAAKAKKAAHAKTKQQAADPAHEAAPGAEDKRFDDIRARCWERDDKAADSLKLD